MDWGHARRVQCVGVSPCDLCSGLVAGAQYCQGPASWTTNQFDRLIAIPLIGLYEWTDWRRRPDGRQMDPARQQLRPWPAVGSGVVLTAQLSAESRESLRAEKFIELMAKIGTGAACQCCLFDYSARQSCKPRLATYSDELNSINGCGRRFQETRSRKLVRV